MFYDANLVLDSLQNTVLKTHLNFAALPRPRPLYVVPPFYASFFAASYLLPGYFWGYLNFTLIHVGNVSSSGLVRMKDAAVQWKFD